jgi:hypothetical protein
MSAACFPGSQDAGDSQVTFPVTAASPPILYNRSQVEEQEEAAMNGRTAGNRDPRRVGALVVAAVVVAMLATSFRVQTYTSYSTGSGPAGSAAYRQEIAFVRCMRGHGVPNLPEPPPGDFISVQFTRNGAGGKSSDPASRAFDACKQLAPRGRETANIKVTL